MTTQNSDCVPSAEAAYESADHLHGLLARLGNADTLAHIVGIKRYLLAQIDGSSAGVS